MSTKRVKEKQMRALGIRKNKTGDYEYIDTDDKNKSKYEFIKTKDPK